MRHVLIVAALAASLAIAPLLPPLSPDTALASGCPPYPVCAYDSYAYTALGWQVAGSIRLDHHYTTVGDPTNTEEYQDETTGQIYYPGNWGGPNNGTAQHNTVIATARGHHYEDCFGATEGSYGVGYCYFFTGQ